jgi:hypothetical protein
MFLLEDCRIGKLKNWEAFKLRCFLLEYCNIGQFFNFVALLPVKQDSIFNI